MTVKRQNSNLNFVSIEIAKAVEKGLNIGGQRVVGTAKKVITRNKNVKTGRLRNSISKSVRRRGNLITEARVGTNVVYAPHIEFGTKPHKIRATKKKVLANRRENMFFGKSVNHPGFSGRPFLRPALKFQTKNITKDVTDAIKRVRY